MRWSEQPSQIAQELNDSFEIASISSKGSRNKGDFSRPEALCFHFVIQPGVSIEFGTDLAIPLRESFEEQVLKGVNGHAYFEEDSSDLNAEFGV